jgi:hypothetical protein
MADVSEVTERLRDYGRRLFDDALVGMEKRLQEVVPVGEPDPLGRPRTGDRLIDTFFRQATFPLFDSFAATIGYTAPQATFSNDLMPPHVIRPRGKGYALRFWWEDGPNGPGEYRYMEVNHPGNVNSRSLGWWDKTVTNENWSIEVDLAVRGVTY